MSKEETSEEKKLREHFLKWTHMRTTYPWGYLALIWNTLFLAAVLSKLEWGSGVLGYLAYGVAVAWAVDFGQERYRYRRYRVAKKRFEEYERLREKE